MGNVIILAIVAIAALLLFSALSQRSRSSGSGQNGRPGGGRDSRRFGYGDAGLPDSVGIRPEAPLDAAAERLEMALSPAFRERLKQRVLSAQSGMTDAEYEWKLVELKRYFLMSAVLRKLPMFSPAVDVIWHEMLMFTLDYQRFCERFAGVFLHHAPHAAPQPMPQERAWFDWVYIQLFAETPFSSVIWGPFCRQPLAKERLLRLQNGSREELLDELFHREAAARHDDIAQTIDWLIDRARRQIDQAPANGERYDRASYASDPMSYMAGAMIGYSLMDDGMFDRHMADVHREDEERRSDAACGTGFSGADGEHADDGGDGGTDDGGGLDGSDSSDGGGGSDSGGSSCSSGDSGGSSCSSCGGGGGD